MYEKHEESVVALDTRAEPLFAALDDPTRLTAHMSRRTWRMAWGRMETILDAQGGRSVGSRIVVRGRVAGFRLHLDEVVTVREPPHRKAWETVGSPHLLVIGPYRLGFEITPLGSKSQLRMFIDYDMPARGFSRLLGRLFGSLYARWCLEQMRGSAARSSGAT